MLLWCNPIEGGRRRTRLMKLLRRVADSGALVSAHPDAILALGTKDVVVEMRDLPLPRDHLPLLWDCDFLPRLGRSR